MLIHGFSLAFRTEAIRLTGTMQDRRTGPPSYGL